jgi:hypothetical protein
MSDLPMLPVVEMRAATSTSTSSYVAAVCCSYVVRAASSRAHRRFPETRRSFRLRPCGADYGKSWKNFKIANKAQVGELPGLGMLILREPPSSYTASA